MCCILILTRLRAEENFSSEEDAGDSTDIQHFFVNQEFVAKFWGSIKNSSSIFFSGQILTMHFRKPKMMNMTQK